MQVLELYINNTRVDLFEDESVTITDTIQNIKDISKVFTAFSQQFNLPASKTNNKLFKHYYNFDIDRGFDGRFTQNALIKLNGVDYKNGKVRLNSVSLKENNPHTYKVVFFGDTIEMKELFGDDDLSALDALSTYDFTTSYILDAFRSGLQNATTAATTLSNRHVVVPFISVKNYYTYDSSTSSGDTNIWHTTMADLQKDLKPAIKVKNVIDAIATKYDLTFSTDFFGCDMFQELYLWCHREKTPITAPDSTQLFGLDLALKTKKLIYSDFTLSSGIDQFNGDGYLETTTSISYSLRLNLQTSGTGVYQVIVRDKLQNEILYQNDFLTGNNLITVPHQTIQSGTEASRNFSLEWRINSEDVSSFSAVSNGLRITKYVDGSGSSVTDYDYSAFNNSNNIYIQDYVPKIKVLDFMTNLFKLFNLTAYKSDSTIVVKTLDDFMTAGTTRDITKYVDVTSKDVDRMIPYNIINFEYDPDVTQTSLRYLNSFSKGFGNLNYASPYKYDGTSYDVKAELSHTQLLNMEYSNAATGIIFGWWVDADSKTTLGKPYLFFNRNVDLSATGLNKPILGDGTTCNSYNAPANTTEDGNHTLNFGNEYDEHTGDQNSNSLFSRFYTQYVTKAFNTKARIVKIKAYLPMKILTQYNLNDVFIISGKEYYINSVQTNLLTNESNLELIPKFESYSASVLT